MDKSASLTGVYGGRGQGKSTHVKALIRNEKRVVVFDPMREYGSLPGFTAAASLHQIRDRMIAGKGQAYKIAYQPLTEDFPLALHQLCRFLFQAQKPYFENRSRADIALVVEELNMTAPSHNLPKGQEGFKAAVLQGRHYGLNIIGVTQRPKLVAPYFRDNCEDEVVFKLACPDSIAYVEKKIGNASDRGQIFALKPHEYLHIQGFNVTKGKNQLS